MITELFHHENEFITEYKSTQQLYWKFIHLLLIEYFGIVPST